jgi:hypothetical protein
MGIKRKVIPVSNSASGKMYEEVEEELHTFLTAELDGEWFALCVAAKISQKTVNLFYQAWCTPQITETGEPMLTF